MKREFDAFGRRIDVWTPERATRFGWHRYGRGTPTEYLAVSLRWLMLRIWR